MKTKLSPDITQAVAELLTLALTTTSDVADVFVSFSPHVSDVSVRVYKHGWREHVDPIYEGSVYVDHERSLEFLRDLTEHVRKTLAEIPTRPTDVVSSKAEQLREAAAKLLAEADAITNPQPVSS